MATVETEQERLPESLETIVPEFDEYASRLFAPGAFPGKEESNSPFVLGRYVLIRSFAHGGLGEVFVARDKEIGREVALKKILAEHADSSDNRGRFVREAEITGNLEHPGIVPVYGYGRAEDGRPYYAMRFIRGESLEEAIAAFHKAESAGKSSGERSTELLRLLERFVHVCDTIEYAHSRGVLHRDIKPANIMLGAHGETLVVDWGLAKFVGRPEEFTGIHLPSPEELDPEASANHTLPGSLLGTPAFMSPEQASGQVESLGTASDVYNLGATLYCLLTDQAPFVRAPLGVLLGKIQKGDFPRPSTVSQTRVAPALEAICLRAMALKPEDRYRSARELASEVRRWLVDEPVHAHRERALERLLRWARRHRGLVQAGMLGILGLLGVIVTITCFVDSERRHEASLRRDAERTAARLTLDHGLNLCEKGEAGSGLLRLAQALTLAPPQSPDLRRTILANLSAWQEPSGSLMTLLPFRGEIRNATFAHDGRVVLCGTAAGPTGPRGEARIWDLNKAEPIGPSLPHDGIVLSVAFSPDDKLIATAGTDCTVRFWDAASGASVGPSLKHAGAVRSVIYTSDGRTLVTAVGRNIHFWNAQTHQEIPTKLDHPDEVNALALSPNGRLLVSGCQDGLVRLWDVASHKLVGSPVEQGGPVSCVGFRRDGKVFLAGGTHGFVRFWTTATQHRLLNRFTHRAEVHSAVFSHDGKLVLTGSDDNSAVLWDWKTGEPVGLPLEHRGSVLLAAFGPDGSHILTGSSDKAVRVWRLPSRQPLQAHVEHAGDIQAIAVRPDGKAFAVAGSEGTISIRDTETLVCEGASLVHGSKVLALAYSHDGSMLLSSGVDALARLWDVQARRELTCLRGHKGPITCVLFSHDGETLMTAGEDRSVRFWNVKDGRALGEPWYEPDLVSAIAESPDGRLVLVAHESTATIRERSSGKPRRARLAHQGPIYCAAFSPDGRIVATGGEDNSVRFWETDTGRPVGSVLEHHASVRSVSFSPDGLTLVTGSNDRNARLWSVETGKPIGRPLRHRGEVAAVAILPDGRSLLSGGSDQAICRWSTPPPLLDNPEETRLRIEWRTGLTLDTNSNPTGIIRMLDHTIWTRLRGRFGQR